MNDALSIRAGEHPDGPALVGPDGTASWGALDRIASAWALKLGRGPGAEGGVVATLLPAGAGFVGLLHGALRSGTPFVPLHPRWRAGEVAAALRMLGGGILVSGEGLEELAAEAIDRLPDEERARWHLRGPALPVPGSPAVGHPEIDDPDPGHPESGRARERPRFRGAGEERAGGASGGEVRGGGRPAVVVFTSGSTGAPRGIALSMNNLRGSIEGATSRLGLGPGDLWYASLSPAHVGGLLLLLRSAATGCRIRIAPTFSPEEVSGAIDREGITHLSLVPTQLHQLLEVRGSRAVPDTLRAVLLGGAAAPVGLVRRALELGIPVHPTWGMTETTSQAATGTPELARRKPGVVGPPLPGVEVRIGAEGEVEVRGPTVALGVLGEAGPLAGDGGWFRTGDVGEIDDEGDLRITGRLSDRIVTGGAKVDPLEVEGVLLLEPGVAEAAVTSRPDPVWGERVVAVVVPAEPEGDWDALRARLEERVRTELSSPRRPREWIPVTALPRTPSGKPDRAAVRRIVAAAVRTP